MLERNLLLTKDFRRKHHLLLLNMNSILNSGVGLEPIATNKTS